MHYDIYVRFKSTTLYYVIRLKEVKIILLLFVFSKTASHDDEVRKLYDEMENQIRVEKERVLAEVRTHSLKTRVK